MIVVNYCEKYRKIKQKGDIYFSGTCFLGDTLVNDERLLNDFKNISEITQFENKLREYNGFFAVIIDRKYECFAAVDRIRSMPLFYGEKNDNFYISNDAEWVRQQVEDLFIDQIFEQEFLLVGYVTGKDTLFKNVKQLQAGEYLYFNGKKKELITKRYYRYLHNEPNVLLTKEEYKSDLDKMMDSIINRLIFYANGRQVVIPLSAGLDSRLIALKLKQHGYQNILCFSYGIKGNYETKVSKKIASILNFRWEYIEYTSDMWKKLWNTNARDEYQNMAYNLTSLPHYQDWPAIWELKNCRVIKENAVLIPGLCADFPAGSLLPPDLITGKKATTADLIYHIKKRYKLILWSKEVKKKNNLWIRRMLDSCEIESISDSDEWANAYEKWIWQEHCAKYIVNSVRVYEFWGYDWWLPFWDNEFMYYWQRVPLQHRKGKKMYNEYVDSVCQSVTGEVEYGGTRKSGTSDKKLFVILLLKKFHLYHFFENILLYMRMNKNNFLNNTNMPTWALPVSFVNKYKNKVSNLNGLFTIDLINDLKGKS